MSEDNLASENYWKASEQKIPGSTRIPVDELKKFLDNKPGMVILDLGSGEGRSTQALKESFPEAKIVAFDLNHKGLEKTISDHDCLEVNEPDLNYFKTDSPERRSSTISRRTRRIASALRKR